MNNKMEFVTRELWILSWAASVQRAKLYMNKRDSYSLSSEVTKFRKNIIYYIKGQILPQYTSSCLEEKHYDNIDSLIVFANKINPGILTNDGYKYGVAQKLLNLALKYHWCLGLVSEPPHCPIDRIIISKTKYRDKINWTQIIRRSQYEKVIKELKELAAREGLSIPQWELMYYSRR